MIWYISIAILTMHRSIIKTEHTIKRFLSFLRFSTNPVINGDVDYGTQLEKTLPLVVLVIDSRVTLLCEQSPSEMAVFSCCS